MVESRFVVRTVSQQRVPPAVSSPVAARSRQALSRTIADQLHPLLELQREIRGSWPLDIDVPRARARLARGVNAFDPAAAIRGAGDLALSFARALVACELAGYAASSDVAAIRRKKPPVTALVLSWISGESTPSHPTKRLARRAAQVIGSAVLGRAADIVLANTALDSWRRTPCPCCGGVPDLALTEGRGGRSVICARCDTRWTIESAGCLACGASDDGEIVRIRSPYLGYTLLVCNECGAYLKERMGSAACLPLVERVLTAQLDEAARSRGLRS